MRIASLLMACWDDAEVRAVILTGNGRAFSGGGDIKFCVAALAARSDRRQRGISA